LFGDPPGAGGPFFAPLDGCATRRIFWFNAEYLLWTISRDHVAPLLTTAPQGTPFDEVTGVGALGDPNTTVLYGSNQLANRTRSGGRFTCGFWLPYFEQWGGEVSYMFLGQRQSSFVAASSGNPILAIPYSNNGLPSGLAIAYPGSVAGRFVANSTSFVWGLEANARRKLICGPGYWVDCLAGYRHLELQESLDVFTTVKAVGTKAVLYQDRFATQNAFNGMQTGMEGQFNFWGRWSIGGFWKLGIGNVCQVLDISGTSNSPAGGFLVRNSGTGTQNRIAALPEVGVKLGWNPTEHLQISAGYDCMYLSNVMRVGEQVGGPIKTSGFWAQGVNFGISYNW
jgi:hypothetical protein